MSYQQEKIKPYSENGEKSKQVEQMFDNIASTYDTLNHRLSWNIDRCWRNKAISLIAQNKPNSVLDVATGTGDFAILTAKKNMQCQNYRYRHKRRNDCCGMRKNKKRRNGRKYNSE